MQTIKTGPVQDTRISLPGSKSYTHRYLIAAALSRGPCRITNWLDSEDTRHTLDALTQMGAAAAESEDFIDIAGIGGDFDSVETPIDLGNSGTSMRLLAGICALGQGPYVLTGSERMKERPIDHLLNALSEIGVEAVSLNGNGCPPIRIRGGCISGSQVAIDCSVSSQYLSSLLLLAPLTENGLSIHVAKGPVSKPYIDMSVDVLNRFGIEVKRQDYNSFNIAGGQHYRPGSYTVEPDASQASYFWAAAAITGASVQVNNIFPTSLQGDVRFARVLEQMGCRVEESPSGITVTGPGLGILSPAALVGIDVDMSDMPDLVPTLAVVAAFAEGETLIRNVGHLRAKESDRLGAVQNELSRMKIDVRISGDSLIISGGTPQGAEIETYNDHRMAMSFAVAGLCTPGLAIKNKACVAKSFPGFWDVFDRLYETDGMQ